MLTRFVMGIFIVLQLIAPLAHAHPGHAGDAQLHVDIPVDNGPDHHSTSVGEDHHVFAAIGISEAIEQRVMIFPLIALAVCLIVVFKTRRLWFKPARGRFSYIRHAVPPPTRAPPL